LAGILNVVDTSSSYSSTQWPHKLWTETYSTENMA